eukprot:5397639-Amphidinium_carterae.4
MEHAMGRDTSSGAVVCVRPRNSQCLNCLPVGHVRQLGVSGGLSLGVTRGPTLCTPRQAQHDGEQSVI